MMSIDRFPHCGEPIALSRASLRQIALSADSGAVLISIWMPVFLVAVKCVEVGAHRVTDRLVGHEPLDSWDR
ncbi:MAG TPA: hypothetical protein VGS10_01475 [Terracidiphilus sp.]|nr:hypothetical protein [Terracidiphilus sp.]